MAYMPHQYNFKFVDYYCRFSRYMQIAIQDFSFSLTIFFGFSAVVRGFVCRPSCIFVLQGLYFTGQIMYSPGYRLFALNLLHVSLLFDKSLLPCAVSFQ